MNQTLIDKLNAYHALAQSCSKSVTGEPSRAEKMLEVRYRELENLIENLTIAVEKANIRQEILRSAVLWMMDGLSSAQAVLDAQGFALDLNKCMKIGTDALKETGHVRKAVVRE